MVRGGWRVALGLVVLPVVVGGLAGCSNGGNHPVAVSSASTAKAASTAGITTAMLKGALLIRVNGVAAAEPVSSGKYASLSQASTGNPSADGGQVTPKACARSATEAIDPTALAQAPAAAVTFRVGANEVSEVLIASSASNASTALAGHVPAECARYQEKVGGKTLTYSVREQPLTGVGTQAKVLSVQVAEAASDDLWGLIYRGTGFVGTVTVVGPNASEKAVQELGQQAYAFAAKSLP